MIDIQCEFIPPPEAPVFEPTAEEFADPLAYVAKIKPIAEKTGICKIKPPPCWQPPFAVNVDTFKFTPRKQRLNELEAGTRLKLNFLDRLARFWELQGNSLRIPNVERKVLDLFTLQKIVTEEGGFENVTKERRWTKIGSRLGYPSSKGVGSTLRSHYDRILYPFVLFNSGITVPIEQEEPKHVDRFRKTCKGKAFVENGMSEIKGDDQQENSSIKIEEEKENDEDKKNNVTEVIEKVVNGEMKEEGSESTDIKEEMPMDDGKSSNKTCSETGEADNVGEEKTVECQMEGDDYKPHNIAETEARGGYTRRSKRERAAAAAAHTDYTGNKELRKLQFYGAGPKAATAELIPSCEEGETDSRISRTKLKKVCYVDLYICLVCNRGDGEEHMLLCDGCDAAYHTFCLIPPLTDIPKGDWRCPTCISKVCHKPHEAFGFEQAKIQYSLQTFGEMADQFKLDYFNMPVHMVPYSTVEKEFWRLVNCIEEDVQVQYGADIHALEMGSGFPTEATENMLPEDKEYLNSGWNLNNFPVLGTSILKYINSDVSGMKVPWCYVGMCFSSFCWHIEDHWSYSINYMHWGEPKTWYGVPGSKAELLEEVMKRNAPDLFKQSPDLLHHITTIMNPNILMAYGVPIVRTDQAAGEFIITFPRSYHAGFNQGYNFAEAVNFCPADWLSIGLECIDHYRMLKRYCVFSHEELICQIASDPEHLDLNLAAATHQDMLCLVEEEKRMRKMLLDQGITESVREAFELLTDEERQCSVCSTTCFLSGITCKCDAARVVCLYHMNDLCTCESSKKILRYRYTLDELPAMLQKLKRRVESFDNWAFKVKSALEEENSEKPDILDLRNLIMEAEEKKFPDSPLLNTLTAAIDEAEKCANVASQLITKKVRTRNRHTSDGKYIAKLSLRELRLFSDQVNALPCIIKEAQLIKELLQKVLDFQKEVQQALDDKVPDSSKLERLISAGIALDVDLEEIPKLKQVLEQARWLDNVNNTLTDPTKVTLDIMRKLIETGVTLAPHNACENAMAKLQDLLTNSERMEEKARLWLNARPHRLLESGDEILQEALRIPSHIPSVVSLQDALKRARELISRITTLQKGEHYPYIDILEGLVSKGRAIPVLIEQLVQIEANVNTAKSWRERTARTFLKKNSIYMLYEVLSPRSTVGNGQIENIKQKKRKNKDCTDNEPLLSDTKVEPKVDDNKDPAATVAAFKVAEQREIDAMLELRHVNNTKSNASPQNLADVKYCVCRKPSQGFMLQCELCKDWFHSTCVPLPKSTNLKNKSSSSSMVSAAKDMRYLCPLCLRSRRPRLETILSLLVSLQKLPVRMIEGEALQCLTERSMAWQDRARHALLTDEISAALAKLSMLSQRAVEQAAREKTEKIINAELLKAANNPDLQGHIQNVAHGQFSAGDLSHTVAGEEVIVGDSEEVIHTDGVTPSSMKDILMPAPVSSTTALMSTTDMSEHAYSSMSKSQQPDSPRSGRKLYSGGSHESVLHISSLARNQLELLMMEGDLLEVSLDETQHIWKILQACQSNMSTENLLNLSVGKSDENDKSMGEILMQGDAREVQMKKYRKRKKDGELLGDVTELEDAAIKAKKKKLKKLKEAKEKLPKLKDLPMKSRARAELLAERKKMRKIKKMEKLIAEGKMLTGTDSDSEENCSAGKCLKPVGQEVSWVQCDLCDLWYHLVCLGMAQSDVNENVEFSCTNCRRQTLSVNVKKPNDNNNSTSTKKKLPIIKQSPTVNKTEASVYNTMTGLMSITGDNSHQMVMDTENSDDLVINDVVHPISRGYEDVRDEIAEFPNFVLQADSVDCSNDTSSTVDVVAEPAKHGVDRLMLDVLREFTTSTRDGGDKDSNGSEIVEIEDEAERTITLPVPAAVPYKDPVLHQHVTCQSVPHTEVFEHRNALSTCAMEDKVDQIPSVINVPPSDHHVASSSTEIPSSTKSVHC